MHYNTIQINQPTRCNNFSSLFYSMFMYSSTCFGRPHAHHQVLNNCSRSIWFYRWIVEVAVMLVVVGSDRPDHDQQHCYHHVPTVKPEAATAVVEHLMMGVRTPETCWAVHKRRVINLRNCCIWLVDLFEFEIGLLLIFRKLSRDNVLNCVQEESGCLSSNYKLHKTENVCNSLMPFHTAVIST